MIQFSRLRLSGFKSFVDKTELEIGAGLNGIVGPNGCGKSNLVEALRWIMGESSAKRMRGNGMEDVIFAGTDKRSPRNIAEVSLLLDNTARTAPAAYNSSDDIEIVRKIEKDKGSGYKINGKNARARDVQMLFADTVTGSNSPALVSQGHVTRMINAKPHDRRLILEESAGISGLYARRHEAELRLRAADTNLARVEDVVNGMESRLNSLKRQARQATKYKNISSQIRQFELTIAYLEWQQHNAKRLDLEKTVGEAESHVATKLLSVTQLNKTYNTQMADLPALRKAEAEIAAALQKHRIDAQRLDDEVNRYNTALKDVNAQISQTESDITREKSIIEDTAAQLATITQEQAGLLEHEKNNTNTISDQDDEIEKLLTHISVLEQRYTTLKENIAARRARIENVKNQVKQAEDRVHTLEKRIEKIQHAQNNANIDQATQDEITRLEIAIRDEEAAREENATNIEKIRQHLKDTDAALHIKRAAKTEADKAYSHCMTEIEMLKTFLTASQEDSEIFNTVLEDISVDSGFETALSRALGDGLSASLHPDAPTHWTALNTKNIAPLPQGLQSIAPYVTAPPELDMALRSIGYVDTYEEGNQYINTLSQGQSVVSKDGDYWRWDGYCVRHSAADRHSVYLEQKTKLAALEKQHDILATALKAADEAFLKVSQDFDAQNTRYEAALSKNRDIDRALTQHRPALTSLTNKKLRVEAEHAQYTAQLATLQTDLAEMNGALSTAQQTHDALLNDQDNGLDGEHDSQCIESELNTAKSEYQDKIRKIERERQEHNTRRARIQAIADERVSLNNRNIQATEHHKSLTTRLEELNSKRKALKDTPVSEPQHKNELLDKIAILEKARTREAEKLAACEYDMNETMRALKSAENALTAMKEKRAAATAMLNAAREHCDGLAERITRDFEMPPQHLSHHIHKNLIAHTVDDLGQLQAQKETLSKDRNAIGAVNLRADEEATALEHELTTILNERNDLLQAIEELRGGINKINKEARARLVAAFEHVNVHFKRLFVQLFGGGKAHLELIDSDDPLGAGLEIFAQPPGKALQSLSLLSGGEQTLASIALIFAMFLTNPSPICVLDEIDAPLDDANVDRVCDLLDEIAARGETRFLIITHHRLSMARMDRLYGVTMAEKGVSQLVSVDLQKSFDFIDQQVA